jgi:hypothetical protein
MHMDVVEIRHRNLLALLNELDGRGATRAKDQAQRLGGMSPSFLSQLKGGKKMGDDVARKIETSVSKPHGWMDQPQWTSDPVSPSDATHAHAPNPPFRRIRIEGAVQMNEQGIWQQGDREAEETSFPTDDPEAYAIRILSHAFQPVLASGQCVVVSPGGELKQGRPALVILMDGRRALRTYQGHDRGVWTFTKVTDGNAFNTWEDSEVAYVERVMAYLWTD